MYEIDFPEAQPCTVLEMHKGKNVIGEITGNWIESGTINAEIWPLKGSSMRNEMGVTEKSTHKLFTTDAIKSNTRVARGADVYLVGYIQNWGTHRTAILEKVG